MTTRTITKTITVDSTVYIACDGKEFDSLKGCTVHEETLKRAEQHEKLKGIETKASLDDVTPLDGGEYMEHHDYRWFRPKSIEEIELLNDLFCIDSGYLTEKHIGEWICVENYDIDSSEESSWVAYLKDSMKHIEDFLGRFGYDITIREREA